jgi:hypothetical protein
MKFIIEHCVITTFFSRVLGKARSAEKKFPYLLSAISQSRICFFFVTRASSTVSKTISLFDSSALGFLVLILTLKIQNISARKLKHYEGKINTAKKEKRGREASLTCVLSRP